MVNIFSLALSYNFIAEIRFILDLSTRTRMHADIIYYPQLTSSGMRKLNKHRFGTATFITMNSTFCRYRHKSTKIRVAMKVFSIFISLIFW